MATDASSYFSNAVPGNHEVFGGNLYRLDAKPKYALGFRVARQDGNVYRYAHFGAATNRGLVVSQDVSETSIADTDNGIVASASALNTNDGKIGQRFIEITMSGVTLNQFQGGYFVTTDDTGEGYTYRIKGNTASGYNGSTAYRLELFEPLQVAVDNTTDYAITGCLWNDVEAATNATDNIPCGVSTATTTSALPYSFVQTWGVCGVLQDADVPTIGDSVIASTKVAGAVGLYFGGTAGTTLLGPVTLLQDHVIGYCLDAGDSTGHSTIMLELFA